MAKFNYSIPLISGITQANNGNFPLVSGSAVQYKDEVKEDGGFKSLDEKISELEGSGKLNFATTDDINDVIDMMFAKYKQLNLSSKQEKITIDDCDSGKLIIEELYIDDSLGTRKEEVYYNNMHCKTLNDKTKLRALKPTLNILDIKLLETDYRNNNEVWLETIYKGTYGFKIFLTTEQLSLATNLTLKFIGTDSNTLLEEIKIFSTDTTIDKQSLINGKILNFNEKIKIIADVKSDNITQIKQSVNLLEGHIMLIKGRNIPSDYIAPALRDYKIVDHANKTAKIIRNVRVMDKNSNMNLTKITENSDYIIFKFDNIISNNSLGYCNICYTNTYDGFAELEYIGFAEKTVYFIASKRRGLTSQEVITSLKNDNYEIWYASENSTEEDIEYFENYNSTAGIGYYVPYVNGNLDEFYEYKDCNNLSIRAQKNSNLEESKTAKLNIALNSGSIFDLTNKRLLQMGDIVTVTNSMIYDVHAVNNRSSRDFQSFEFKFKDIEKYMNILNCNKLNPKLSNINDFESVEGLLNASRAIEKIRVTISMTRLKDRSVEAFIEWFTHNQISLFLTYAKGYAQALDITNFCDQLDNLRTYNDGTNIIISIDNAVVNLAIKYKKGGTA